MAEINRTPPRDKVSESSSSSDVETYPTPRSRRQSLKTAAPLRIEHDVKTSEGQAEPEFPYRDFQMFLGDPAHMSAILTPLMKHYFYTLKQNVQLEMEADGSATLEKQSGRRDSSSMRPAHLRTTSKQRNIKTEQSNSSRNSPDSRMLRLVAVQSSPEARSLSPPRMQIPVSIKQESATTY
uniref:Uncharacterized protein n=1 Tax=Ciona savignyi TaxID=51511 RepID=H2Z711_CIOSA